MTQNLGFKSNHKRDFWYARAAIALVACLQLLIINQRFRLGAEWLFASLEVLLLMILSFSAAWTHWSAREAKSDPHWRHVAERRRRVRRMAVALTALVTITNLASLTGIVSQLFSETLTVPGRSLLLDAMNIWATNVIAFALWFWTMDWSRHAARHLGIPGTDDFLFPQMTHEELETTWSPGFLDYIYLSFTNATAFSPTDTMPLTGRAKMLMLVESSVSLITLALVAARAVNILK